MNKQYRFSHIDLVRLETALDYFINNFFIEEQCTSYIKGIKGEYNQLYRRICKIVRSGEGGNDVI